MKYSSYTETLISYGLSNLDETIAFFVKDVLVEEAELNTEEIDHANKVLDLLTQAEELMFEWPGKAQFCLDYLRSQHISHGEDHEDLIAKLELAIKEGDRDE